MPSARNVGGLEGRYAQLGNNDYEEMSVSLSHESPYRDDQDIYYEESKEAGSLLGKGPSFYERDAVFAAQQQRKRLSLVMVLCFAVILGVVGGVVLPDAERSGWYEGGGDDDGASTTTTVTTAVDGCGAEDVDGFVTCSYLSESLLAFGSVRSWLFNATGNASDSATDYLPRRLEVKYNAGRMAPGSVGPAAAGGYVAFGLYLPSYMAGDGAVPVNASFLVVAKTNGSLVAVTPTSGLDGLGSPRSTRVDAVKVYSPSHLLAASDEWGKEVGYPYLWNWRRSAYDASGETHLRRLDGDARYSSLDVQWAEDNASWWQPTGAADEPGAFAQFDATTGAVLRSYAVPVCDGLNHAQLYDNDTRALLSCGGSNGVVAYDLANAAVLWVAGGANGTLPVYTLGGERRAPGEVVWAGQYNAEYWGADTITMFDNRCDAADGYANKSSRLLVLRERDGVVTTEFEYELRAEFPYGYSPAFGDADLLPSTNLVASWWPNVLSPSRDLLFDAQLLEVDRSREVAWQLSVYGAASDACAVDGAAACRQDIDRGWKIYSVERFYDAPLVYNVSFVRDPGASSGTLEFLAHTAFKRGYKTHGRWALTGPQGAAHGDFKFEAHWRAKHVTVNVTNATRLIRDTATLAFTVLDEYDQVAAVDVPYA